MDSVGVPLVVIQVVAISLVVIDLLLLSFVVVYRLIEGSLNSRRMPELSTARKSMVTAIAGAHQSLGEEAPQLRSPASLRLSMLAAAQLLNTIKGEAQSELVHHLLLAGYDTRAIVLLRSRHGLERGVACELLGALGLPEYALDLTQMIEDSDPDVRNTAVRGLGRLRNPSAIACLLRSLEHSDGAPPALVGAALLRIGPAGAPELRTGLTAQYSVTRALCAKVLGLLDDFEASHELVGLLLDETSRLPLIEAANALGRVGGQSARAPLMHCVQTQTDVEVRIAAIGALSAIIDDETQRMLLCLLHDENPHIARAAASALEKSGPGGREALKHLMGDIRAQAYAAEVLAVGQLERARKVGAAALLKSARASCWPSTILYSSISSPSIPRI